MKNLELLKISVGGFTVTGVSKISNTLLMQESARTKTDAHESGLSIHQVFPCVPTKMSQDSDHGEFWHCSHRCARKGWDLLWLTWSVFTCLVPRPYDVCATCLHHQQDYKFNSNQDVVNAMQIQSLEGFTSAGHSQWQKFAMWAAIDETKGHTVGQVKLGVNR